MGNDGGSIPTRRELVKEAARAPTVSELKATALENLSHAWTHDPLTLEPLDMENVVSDWRGRLYNYESILKGLVPGGVDKDDAAAPSNGESPGLSFAAAGIKSLRDVVKLKFRRYSPPGTKGKDIWACPVTLKELGAATRAVYLVPCGHVFAETAIKQIQEEVCPECSEQFQKSDIIPILSTEKSDLDFLSSRIEKLRARGLTHSLKKDKSSSKKKRKAEETNGNGEIKTAETREPRQEQEMAGKPPSQSDITSRINNAATASLTAKVLAEQDERNKRRKLAATAK